ncbi:MAG: hypothetical protein OEU26_03165 [Candidatus Tectomicrobia bacterium]|nr:hypothetical protein [Candidatus Tectomicrobia bacterium]
MRWGFAPALNERSPRFTEMILLAVGVGPVFLYRVDPQMRRASMTILATVGALPEEVSVTNLSPNASDQYDHCRTNAF